METPFGQVQVIDAHTHFFSYRFFQSFADLARNTLEGTDLMVTLEKKLGVEIPPHHPAELAQRWVAEFDKYGVEKGVFFASVVGDEDSVGAAVRAFPDRLIGYMMLNPLQEGALDQLGRGVEQLGMKGMTLFPAMHHFQVDDERIYPLYQQAQKYGLPVFVHFGVLKIGIRDKLGLPNIFDLRYANPLNLHKVAIDFPRINFIIPHFGCGFFRETLMLGAQAPNVYVDTSSSNTWLTYQEATIDLKTVFEKALSVFGSKRILFGTDSNIFPRGWRMDICKTQLEVLQSLSCPKEEVADIMGGNIRRLLSLS